MDKINNFPQQLSVKEAIALVQKAMDEYGSPMWAAMIPARIRRMVPQEKLGEMIADMKNGVAPAKRADKYEAIYAWASERVFEHISPKQIMEVGNISYPTALKLIENRPDIFKKVKNGVYEIRDPKEDRRAVKK